MPRALLLFVASWLALGCGSAPEPGARHAILLSVDTWRADHYAVDRGGVAVTPRLAHHGARALRFLDATSAAASTAPGVASLMSGLRPSRSRVLRNEDRLPRDVETLATRLRAAGFATAAFVSNPVLRPGRGFDRGFDHYERIEPEPGGRKVRAEAVNARALAWLDDAAPDARLFLWIHYMEPHGPYLPPPDALALFDLEAFDAPRDVPLQPDGRHSGLGAIPHYQQYGAPHPRDARDYLRRYAAEVRSLDTALAQLLAALDQRGLLAQAAWVLTSDHGEALAGDHGHWFSHDAGVTRDQLHVPLLLAWPGVEPASVEVPVASVDVMPTLLALLGVEAPPDLDGISLLAPRERLLFARSRREQMVRRGRFVLRIAGDREALYDLAADPAERHDVAAERRDVAASLRAAHASNPGND